MWALLFLTVLLVLLHYFQVEDEGLKKVYPLALVIKVLAAVVVGVLYEKYWGGGDTWQYFENAKALHQQLLQTPSLLWHGADYDHALSVIPNAALTTEPRSWFFLKLLAVLMFWFKGYYALACLLSLFAFFSSVYVTERLRQYFKTQHPLTLVPFLFYPSMVFWSSGLLKDTVAFMAFNLLLGGFLTLIGLQGSKKGGAVLLLLGAFLLWELRYYVFLVFIPVLAVGYGWPYLQQRYWSGRSSRFFWITGITALIVILAILPWLHPVFYTGAFLHFLKESYVQMAAASPKGSFLHFPYMQEPGWHFLVNVPKALWNGLFGPLPWQVSRPLALAFSFENVALLLLFCWALAKSWKVEAARRTWQVTLWIGGIVLLATAITLATPNFGTLVRYKTVYLPLFAFLLSIKATRKGNAFQ